ncbi:putative disease resistance protein [Mucuna pruriens]|uniref:Disease resistance protein n=1 Tax=Mucuna pruriens TaxID=157652 RepID=A0A371E6K4_MUCPR|nr:putative disease resistance protein [Mucuna pruriens]
MMTARSNGHQKITVHDLANVLVARKKSSDSDNYYYSNHFVILHDFLRELTIYQNTQEPIEQRKRLITDINDNKDGVLNRIPIRSQSEHCLFQLYPLPEYMEKMSEVKVLFVTNCGFYPSKLDNFKLLDSVFKLKRIRLEQISVPNLGTRAFENGTIPVSYSFPNLVELNVVYSKDMVGMPAGVCDLTPLKKLRIRDSIGNLSKVRLLDISKCTNLKSLPKDINNLRNLYMTSCARCELPYPADNLENLKVVM